MGGKDFKIKPQADVREFRASYNCDLFDNISSGAIIIPQVLFAKQPSDIKGKLIKISGKTNPTLSAILSKTLEIVKRFLIIKKPERTPVVKQSPPPPRLRVKEEEDKSCFSPKMWNQNQRNVDFVRRLGILLLKTFPIIHLMKLGLPGVKNSVFQMP